MAYTEKFTTSWTSRVGNAFKGILIGFVLIIIGTILLWWNEGRNVGTNDAIKEASLNAISLDDIDKIDPANNSKLIHASAIAKAIGMVKDEDFDISIDAIGLERFVSYYQWVENTSSKTEKKIGGSEETTTTYTYEKKWVNLPIDSSLFKEPAGHENKINAHISNQSFYANKVAFGSYFLNENQIKNINGAKPLQISVDTNLMSKVSKKFNQNVLVKNNSIYVGLNANEPQIGDVEITFLQIPNNQTISIIAQINNDTFKPWKASNGKLFSKLVMGERSLDEMIQIAQNENLVLTWVLRIVGGLLIIFGFRLLLAPLAVLADVLPFLGSIVGFGVGALAFVIGLAWSLIIIAIAWIRFRPILAITLLIVAILCIFILFKFKKPKNNGGSNVIFKHTSSWT